MFQRQQMQDQLRQKGVRMGDSCSILPTGGRRKAITLNRYCIDLVSSHYRPVNLSLSYVELQAISPGHFHYRLELDEKNSEAGRFVLKTIEGRPFWINGLAAKEAYVERSDKLYIEEHKLNFDFSQDQDGGNDLDHPVLCMKQLLESDLKILIQGETGTGKSHLAKKIHEASGRKGHFVAVNLSSFNPNLIESELFGHKKGSFTGACEEHKGAFALAEYGTLFLDEIDSLTPELQTKLLTFIDNKSYRRVGEAHEKEIRTRLIFASGRQLEMLVSGERFRKDFFFRLKSGHTIDLPSLRNDPFRIIQACGYFANKNGVALSERLMEFYPTLAWPGNVRQLFGHLEKKKVLSRGPKFDFDEVDEGLLLESSDLMALSDERKLLTMEQCKLNHLKRVLLICEGNVGLAARKLCINEKTVRNLLLKIS